MGGKYIYAPRSGHPGWALIDVELTRQAAEDGVSRLAKHF